MRERTTPNAREKSAAVSNTVSHFRERRMGMVRLGNFSGTIYLPGYLPGLII
jgi:hypothetical protein